MPANALSRELEVELEGIAAARGCELLHAEFAGGVLRLVLDRLGDEGGVGLADCEAVSKEASAVLDVAEFGRGRYTLEVSSPGLDRLFYRPSDYERFLGRRIRCRFRDPETGKRATVIGRLATYLPENGGEIELTETESKRDYRIRLAEIEQSRLTIEL
jgi:ribosome maturation factor RimP